MRTGGPSFSDVLVDGKKVGEQEPDCGALEQEIRYFDVEYPVPADSIADKKKVTVRFEATNGRSTPSVFGVRIVRAGYGSVKKPWRWRKHDRTALARLTAPQDADAYENPLKDTVLPFQGYIPGYRG